MRPFVPGNVARAEEVAAGHTALTASIETGPALACEASSVAKSPACRNDIHASRSDSQTDPASASVYRRPSVLTQGGSPSPATLLDELTNGLTLEPGIPNLVGRSAKALRAHPDTA